MATTLVKLRLIKTYFSLILIIWVGIPNMTAQNHFLYVQHFGVKEGLSHRFVRNTFQDSRGLIWVSTNYGLNRYDGHKFTIFTKEQNGLSSNAIKEVIEDPGGWLWIFSSKYGKEHGWDFIDLLNINTMEIIPWKQKYPSFPVDSIKNCIGNVQKGLFIQKLNGDIWKLNSKGIFKRIFFQDTAMISIKYISGSGTIWGIEKHKKSVDWVEIDTSGNILKKIINKGYETGFPIGEDEEKRFWYSCKRKKVKEFFFISGDTIKKQIDLSEEKPDNMDIRMFRFYSRAYIDPVNYSFWWIGNDFIKVEYPRGKIVQQDISDLPKPQTIRHLMFDKTGAAWFSTLFGLYRMQIKESKFKNLLSKTLVEEDKENLIQCRGILKTGDNIFINTNKGTFCLDEDGNIIKDNYLNSIETYPPNISTLGLFQTREKQLWFGGQTPIRQKLNSAGFDIFYAENNKRGIKAWAIYQDTTGTMWFGGMGGQLYYLEPGQKYLQKYSNYGEYEDLRKTGIYQFFEDDNKNVWLSTSKGLFLLDPYNKSVLQHYWTGGEGRFYLPADNIYYVHQDKIGIFWIATGGNGLIKFNYRNIDTNSENEKNKYYRQYLVSDGLSSNVIYVIYEDDFDNLWMSSDYGVIRFNKKSGKFKAFLPKDGLPHYEFNRISGYQSPEGEIYFGSLNGVTSFDPKDFEDTLKDENYAVVLIDIEQFDGKEKKIINKLQQFYKQKKIILNPQDRMVNIYFSMLNYEDNDHIRYFYKVNELDKSWTYLPENKVTLSGLPYGNFNLKIKGQSASGVFSDQILNIPVFVAKPVYFKTWFIILMIFLIAGLIMLYLYWKNIEYKRQEYRLKQEIENQTKVITTQNKELLEKTQMLLKSDQMKSRFFANISHELRTPLTLLLGPLKMVLKRNKLKDSDYYLVDNAYRNGSKLFRLINELLDLSKMESGKLKLNEYPVKIYKLLSKCFASFESLAEIKNISFQFEYSGDENLSVFIDEVKFEKIVYNYLSNALKFTPNGGEVILDFKEQDDFLLLSVTDNGKGIHPDDMPYIFNRFFQTNQKNVPVEGGTGIGLALVKEYAHLFEAKAWAENIYDENNNIKACVFYFKWPKKISEDNVKTEKSPIAAEDDTEIVKARENAIKNEKNILKPTILVVEDNQDMREYICFILKKRYNTVKAENGLVAIEKLKKIHKCHLIISDIMMPEMDGFQFIEQLKMKSIYRSIPIIILSARADIKDKLKALRTGVDDYILKPFDEEELIVRVNNLLLRNKERTEFYKTNHIEKISDNELKPTQEFHLADLSVNPSKEDIDWLITLEKLIIKEVQNDLLSVSWLSGEMNLSERQIQRRLKLLTGLTPNLYIREVRLQEARYLLETGKVNSVKQVAWKVSYRDEKYFSQLFKERFGKLPSEYFLS